MADVDGVVLSCGPMGAAAFAPCRSLLCGPGLTLRAFAPRSKRARPKKQWVATDGSLPPRRIAVVGGGLAGLATAWHTLHSTYRMAKKRGMDHEEIAVTLYDPCAPGEGGATAAAAGLLHPFTPRVKKKAWQAKKALPAASHLVTAVQPFADDPAIPLLRMTGILRLALDERAKEDYQVAARRYPFEVKYWEAEEVANRCAHAGATGLPAAFLPHGAIVDVKRYTKALMKGCLATGRMQVVHQRVDDVRTPLAEHDAVIVCAGAGVLGVDGLRAVPVTPCRGQNVLYRPLEGATQPTFPIIHGKYVVPAVGPAGGLLLGGATFEYMPDDTSEQSFAVDNQPNVRHAAQELAEPLARIVPSLPHFWEADASEAGVRALPPRSALGSVPLAARCQGVPDGKSLWVLTGLGSRGVLHHALMGRLMAHAVVAGNEKLIPIDARRVQMTLAH